MFLIEADVFSITSSLLILCGLQGLWQWGKPDLLFPRFFVLICSDGLPELPERHGF